MNAYYFSHINLPFATKSDVVSGILKAVAVHKEAMPRDKFGERFITDRTTDRTLQDAALKDGWFAEHVDRLFWVCCELGLLQYQYSYPHAGQTYKLTRLGRLLAGRSRWLCRVFMAVAYVVARTAGPVQYFSKIRNFTTVMVGTALWLSEKQLSGFVVGVSIICGIISTWIASFYTEWSD